MANELAIRISPGLQKQHKIRSDKAAKKKSHSKLRKPYNKPYILKEAGFSVTDYNKYRVCVRW